MSLNILIFASIIAFVIWLYIKWYKMKTFWIQKGIPQCPVHPIWGSLTFLQKINPNIWLADVYKQYQSPYIGIWAFWRPGLIINSPQLARNILVKDADNFRNRNLGSGKKHDLGSLNLFTVDDPLWTSIRKRLTSVFTAAKLRGWHDLYHSKAVDLVQRIKSDNEKGINSSLRALYADYTTDIIGESSFGIKCEATKNAGGPLRSMTAEWERYNTFRGIQWSSIFFLPELAGFLGFALWPKHTMAYFQKVFNMIVQERGGYEKPTDGKRDLMDALVKMKQDAQNDTQKIDELVVISNALIFLQGGYDTSSTTLAYLTYELAHRPDYQQRLYEEVTEARSRIKGTEFDANDLAEMSFLNAVIKETMRKYPIMGWLDRIAANDYQVDEHLTIPAGTVVYINVNGMQHDPKLYPDPEQFLPERFLPENERNIVPYSYLPFGEGPRSCIGKRFGMNTIRYALAKLSTDFIFKPLPNAQAPNDLAVETKGLFYLPRDELSVNFVLRR